MHILKSIRTTLYVGLHYSSKPLFDKIITEINKVKLVTYYKPNNVLIATGIRYGR